VHQFALEKIRHPRKSVVMVESHINAIAGTQYLGTYSVNKDESLDHPPF